MQKMNINGYEGKLENEKVDMLKMQNIRIIGNSGITLIALVVSIIIILILAGISISILKGNNGIIKQAQNSKEQHEIASEKETLQLAVSEAFTEYAKKSKSKTKTTRVTTETLKNTLSRYDEISSVEESEDEDGVDATFKESGRIYFVDIDGNVIEKTGEPSIGISANKMAKNPEKYIGAKVTGYNPKVTTDVGWFVFYVGNEFDSDNKNRIYLIADNYVETANLPITKSGIKVNTKEDNIERDAWLRDIVNGNDYAGESSINDKLKILNSKYFQYLKENNETGRIHMNAIAYMMDTTIWGDNANNVGFIDQNFGDYVIGGPSEELLLASYNKKTGADLRAKVDGVRGYKIGKYTVDNTGKETTNYDYIMLLEDDTGRGLYSGNWGANFLWMCSPAGAVSELAVITNNVGYINFHDYQMNGSGFRPIVCLKQGVKLEEVSTDTFQLIQKNKYQKAISLVKYGGVVSHPFYICQI